MNRRLKKLIEEKAWETLTDYGYNDSQLLEQLTQKVLGKLNEQQLTPGAPDFPGPDFVSPPGGGQQGGGDGRLGGSQGREPGTRGYVPIPGDGGLFGVLFRYGHVIPASILAQVFSSYYLLIGGEYVLVLLMNDGSTRLYSLNGRPYTPPQPEEPEGPEVDPPVGEDEPDRVKPGGRRPDYGPQGIQKPTPTAAPPVFTFPPFGPIDSGPLGN
jgi:hypothetical protein